MSSCDGERGDTSSLLSLPIRPLIPPWGLHPHDYLPPRDPVSKCHHRGKLGFQHRCFRGGRVTFSPHQLSCGQSKHSELASKNEYTLGLMCLQGDARPDSALHISAILLSSLPLTLTDLNFRLIVVTYLRGKTGWWLKTQIPISGIFK